MKVDGPVFGYRKPTDDEKFVMTKVNQDILRLHDTILSVVPGSEERSLAIRKLQECRMWINAGVVLNGLPE